MGFQKVVPTTIEGVETLLDFYIFKISPANLLIGQPLSKLLTDGVTKGHLDAEIGRNKFTILLTLFSQLYR